MTEETDEYVQVLNPKTMQYTLINKTTGTIEDNSVDGCPFHDIPIVSVECKVHDEVQLSGIRPHQFSVTSNENE